MDSGDAKISEGASRECKLPEVRDLTPDEEAQLDRMHDDVGRMFYGEKWPEVRERWR
ncbi:MAG: hypothetical protein JO069_05610, partial [Verrucomicrobia bacterium]|nr:hypothetical protein [Verrucomicrobiota bacterium]